MTSTGKRRYVVPSASPPPTSDSCGSSTSSSDEGQAGLGIKKKRKCTRNKPNYNENAAVLTTNITVSSAPPPPSKSYRESYVFSTALANVAASAVKHRMCDSIIVYHKGIPREPNKLTIKTPKVTSKLLATSSVKNRKREREEERRRASKPKPKPARPSSTPRSETEVKCSKTNGTVKSPLTPPRSPSAVAPLATGDFSLSVSERIKCRARACAPKFYGDKEEQEGGEEAAVPARVSVRTPSARTPPAAQPRDNRRRSAEKSRKQSTERAQRRARRDSIESDGEKIRNILENSEKGIKPEPEIATPVEDKQPRSVTREFPRPQELLKPLKSPKLHKSEPKTVSPKIKEEQKPPTPVTLSPKPLVRPSPPKAEYKPKPRLTDVSNGLFEAAMTQKLKSPIRLKKQISSETKQLDKPPEPPALSLPATSSQVAKFKPVKQSSPTKEPAPPPVPEAPDNNNIPKFKPLPLSGTTKKSKTFKFRTPQGTKQELSIVDSIFNNIETPSELTPRSTKSPTTPPITNVKIPVTKLSDKPPRPELVMGIPNLQGPSKPPMLTPAHNSIFPHGSLQHIIRSGPPPLSSPKIAVTTKSTPPPLAAPGLGMNRISPNTRISPPVNNHHVAPKRPSNEHHPASGEQRKKKRFAFPEESTSPVKVTSPISPPSPRTLKGPGSSRVSPISPIQSNMSDNLLNTPMLRNGIPLHKPSPKNSPQNRRLEFLADFSGRRSPLVKVPSSTSPITPKASPSTVGQFYQPNVSVSLTSCSRNDLNLSDSVLEHSKLSGQQIVNRAPVVTINHQTISLEQDRGRDQAPKARLTVESEFSKKHQQEMLARQQLYSRAFSSFSLPNPVPTTTAAGKLNKQQFELTQQLKQQDIGSLVDLYGRGEKEHHSQPAFPTPQLRQAPNPIPSGRGGPRQQSPRQRTIPTELLVQQNRERLISQQQERLLAQQRQYAASAGRDHQVHSPLFAQRQEALLHRPAGATNQHLQHLPYSGGMLNQLGYPHIGLNPQLYKQLTADSALTQVTSASLLQSLAGFNQQLQLAAAAASKFGPLAHLYQSNTKPGDDPKPPNHFGVIRP